MNRVASKPAPGEQEQGLSYPFSTPPALGEALEISADIKWLRFPMPYALDHVNLYLLRVEGGWLLFDTALDSPENRRIWEDFLAGPFRGETVRGIFCSHYHVDHAGLAGYLSERLRVPLYMSYREYFTLRGWPMDLKEVHWQHAQFFRKAGLPDELLPGTLTNFDFAQETSEPPPAFLSLRQGNPFPLAGGDWQVMTGEGHSPEHAMLHSAGQALLFSGDQLLPRISSNVSVSVVSPQDEPMSGWLATLDRLAGLPDQVLVLPGHGLPFRGARARVEELQQHHQLKFRAILSACAQVPLSAYQLTLILYPRPLSDFNLQLALGESLAHLYYLRDRGRLVERGLEGGAVGYLSLP